MPPAHWRSRAAPGITRVRLALAHKLGKVLREVDRLGHLSRLCAELRELLGLGVSALRLASEHEPCGPARCQGLARRLSHRGQGVVRAAVPGRQALSLPQAAGRGCDRALTRALGIRARPISGDHLHPGCSRSHCATVSAVRSGSSATGWRRSRSTRIVPYVCRFRRAKSSTPSTVGVGHAGMSCLRSRRRSVFRLTARPQRWLRRIPALPPKARPTSPKCWASRKVRRAQGAVRAGSRSVKMRRRQEPLRHNHLRTRSWRHTRYAAHGKSARVRVYRLWIRRAGMAHSGQGTLVCVERTRRVICAAVVSGRVPDRCGEFHCPSNPLQCPVSPCRRGGNIMVSHLFYYQLALLVLVWLFVMLHVAESRRGTPIPPTVTPIKPKSKRSNAPKPFHGLTKKPHCALCARETAHPKAPPPVPPDPMAPTHRRPRDGRHL